MEKVQQSPKTTKAPVHSVVAANGEKLELVGQGEVSITIGGVTRRHMVLVTNHLTQECILGVDFLTKHACVVDLYAQQHTFVIDGKIVQFNHSRVAEDVCFVSISETVTVPAAVTCTSLPLPLTKGKQAPDSSNSQPWSGSCG